MSTRMGFQRVAFGTLLAAALACGSYSFHSTAFAADRQGGPGGPGGPGGDGPPPPPPPNMRQAMDSLDLTEEQKAAVDPIVKDFHDKQRALHEDFLKQMKAVLTPEQYAKLDAGMRMPPPRRQRGDDQDGPPGGPPPATQPQAESNQDMPADGSHVAVNFTGGHDTDPRDHGRPVILVASALGVSSDVFRDAFSRVHPAGPNSGGPTDAEARSNKKALMDTLSPYGVTDARLNEVSNYYRYMKSRDGIWKNVAATGYATVDHGKVAGVTITNPGAGYTTAPTVSVPGVPDAKVIAKIAFGMDFKTNGSVQSLSLATDASAAQ